MKNQETIYIGIDFAKDKFDACYLDDDGVTSHAVFANIKKEFSKLLSWVKSNAGIKKLDPMSVIFCGEHTGSYSIELSEWLVSKGYRIWLENALRIKRSAGIVRGKSDKADALMIAKYAMEKFDPRNTRLFVPDSADIKELRSLYFCRQDLVRQRVANGNRLASNSLKYSRYAVDRIKRLHDNFKNVEEEFEKKMEKLMKNSAELRGNYEILMSFNGIGVLTAAMFLIYTSNFTRFDNPREFACQCGVAPFGQESGSSIHTAPHVSHYAHRKAKASLTESTLAAMRYNPAIREYAQRLHRRGKSEGLIKNNIKNKIIHIVFKMINTRTKWDPNYQESHKSGNQSKRPLGGQSKKGAAAATPFADMSVQTSPSTFGGMQIYAKTEENSNLPDFSCPKTCSET